MGIQAEYNPDLALRNISEFRAGRRKLEECVTERLETGRIYDFLKKGQRLFWLSGEIPLRETDGKKLSRPLASVIILEATHFLIKGETWTKGKYKVIKILSNSKNIYFEGFEKVE